MLAGVCVFVYEEKNQEHIYRKKKKIVFLELRTQVLFLVPELKLLAKIDRYRK